MENFFKSNIKNSDYTIQANNVTIKLSKYNIYKSINNTNEFTFKADFLKFTKSIFKLRFD